MKTVTVIIAALILSISLFSGCLGNTDDETTTPDSTQPFDENITPDEVSGLTNLDVPLIEENDTVEIGEMI